MMNPGGHSEIVVFGSFEADLKSGELRKAGMRVKLALQPFAALRLLLDHPHQVITSEELKQHLWPDIKHGDLDSRLKKVINRTRVALGDSADSPRFIETLPGRGYRFIAPVKPGVTAVGRAAVSSDVGKAPALPSSWFQRITRAKAWVLACAIAAVGGISFLVVRAPIARFYNNRGIQHQREGDLRKAIVDYQRSLWYRPGYAEAHYNLADAYEEIPDYDRALQEYKNAIEADSMFYEAYNNLARLYILRRRDHEAVVRLLDHAMRLNPTEPSLRYTLLKNQGWAYFESQEFGQAQKSLKAAVALDPGRGAAHCLLAKVFDIQNRTQEALPEWESCAADTSPTDVELEWRNEAQERLRKESMK